MELIFESSPDLKVKIMEVINELKTCNPLYNEEEECLLYAKALKIVIRGAPEAFTTTVDMVIYNFYS